MTDNVFGILHDRVEINNGGKKSVLIRHVTKDEIKEAFEICLDAFMAICPECENPKIQMDWSQEDINTVFMRGFVRISER